MSRSGSRSALLWRGEGSDWKCLPFQYLVRSHARLGQESASVDRADRHRTGRETLRGYQPPHLIGTTSGDQCASLLAFLGLNHICSLGNPALSETDPEKHFPRELGSRASPGVSDPSWRGFL